jgi:hypothetical protein
MEAIQIVWTVTFFFFTLILIFIWSKALVISKKMENIVSLIEQSEKNAQEDTDTVDDVGDTE